MSTVPTKDGTQIWSRFSRRRLTGRGAFEQEHYKQTKNSDCDRSVRGNRIDPE